MPADNITERLQAFYTEYKFCVVRITVSDEKEDLHNGTGFHIGEGVIVTAKHVLEKYKLKEIVGHFEDREYNLKDIVYPDDKNLDLALLITDFTLADYMSKKYKMPPMIPKSIKKHDSIPLSWYLTDKVGKEIELMKVLVFGYPKVPFSAKSDLIVTTGEVNAFIKKYGEVAPYFIISIPPRGGYSGGPVISESGHVFGIMTESLYEKDKGHESGFFAVTPVDGLLKFMKQKGINPNGFNEEEWFALGGPGYKKAV